MDRKVPAVSTHDVQAGGGRANPQLRDPEGSFQTTSKTTLYSDIAAFSTVVQYVHPFFFFFLK